MHDYRIQHVFRWHRWLLLTAELNSVDGMLLKFSTTKSTHFGIMACCCPFTRCVFDITSDVATTLTRQYSGQVGASFLELRVVVEWSPSCDRYMSFFAGFGLCRMHAQSTMNPAGFTVEDASSGEKTSSPSRGKLSPADVKQLGEEGGNWLDWHEVGKTRCSCQSILIYLDYLHAVTYR